MPESNSSGVRSWLHPDLAKLFSDSAVVFSVRFAAAILTYATQVLLANWMGASELGVLVYAMAWLWILNVVAVMGLASAAYRFMPQYKTANELPLLRGFVHWSRLSVIVIGAGIGLTGASVILGFEPGPAVAQRGPLLLAFAVLPIIALTTLHSGIARANLWFAFASLTGVLLRPALLLLAVAAAWSVGVIPSATRVMSILAVIIVLVCVLQYLGLRRRLAPVFTARDRQATPRLWLRVGATIVIAELFVGYFTDINLIISGAYLEPAQIAVFNAALRTVAIMAFGITAVGVVVAPRAARLFTLGDMAQLQRLVRTATHLMLWPSLAALIVLVVFGKAILGLFGDQFVIGYNVLLIAGLAQVVIAAAGPLLPLLNVAGQQARCVPVFAVALVLTPALYALLMPRLGMAGGALALLLVSVVWCGWLCALVVRYVGVQPSFLRPRPGMRT